MLLFGKKSQREEFESNRALETDLLNLSAELIYVDLLSNIRNYDASKLKDFAEKALSIIAKELEILQAAWYTLDRKANPAILRFLTGYACNPGFDKEMSFQLGEGLPGQVLKSQKVLILTNIPEGYVKIQTALGEASPNTLIILPLINKTTPIGVIELASFKSFVEDDEKFFSRLAFVLSEKLIGYLENEKK